MKKMFLVLMLVVLSSLSFADRGDKGSGSDFYSLYNSAYEASGNPSMHKDYGIENDEAEKVRSIINKGWYEIKLLEVDKLKEVFAIDMLLVDGPGNQKKVQNHLEKIRKISDKMSKVHDDTKAELNEVMDVDKLMK